MTNFRWGIIAAITALFFSVVIGIIGGVAPIHIFLRALLFSAIFFGLGFGLRFVVNSFFPELLFPDSEETTEDTEEQAEEYTPVSMDSTGEYAVPELYNIPSGSQEMGNIEDLISGIFRPRSADGSIAQEKPNMGFGTPVPAQAAGAEGIDRNNEAGYNGFGAATDSFQATFKAPETSVFEQPHEEPAAQQQFTPSFGDDSGLGGLPDLDMMAMAFSSFTGGVPAGPASAPAPQAAVEVEEAAPDRKGYNTGNKPQALEGDFDPKSLAEGIRTVLSKD